MHPRIKPVKVRIANKAFSDPVAICAGAIALCALLATIWQGALMREHNRKSMRPYLEIRHNFALPDEWLGTSISNEGPGPAILQEVTLLVDGEAILNVERNGWPIALARLGLKKKWVKFRHFNPGDILKSGSDKPLMGTPAQEADDAKKSALRKEAMRLTVQVCYCSVYDECFVIRDRYRVGTVREEVGNSCSGWVLAPPDRLMPDPKTVELDSHIDRVEAGRPDAVSQ